MQSPNDILALWPDRRSIWDDARAANPKLEFVAVHRWFQRGRIPADYWSALLTGARKREIILTADELANAHAFKRVAA